MNSLRQLIPLLMLALSACSSVSDKRPEPLRKSEYYLEHGVSAFENSDYVTASDFLNKALAHYRSIDDTSGILLSRINLAETALAAGTFEAVAGHLDAAEKLSNRSGYHGFQPRLTLLRAQLHWRQHQGEKALQLLNSLLPEFDTEHRSKEKGDLVILGATTLRTAIAFAAREEPPQEALLWLRRLSLMLPATDGRTELHHARLLRFEAELAYRTGDTEQAIVKFEAALQRYREAATRPAIAATLTELGKLLVKLERWQEAEERLQGALYIRLWIMDRPGSLEVLGLLQTVYQQLGDEARYLQLKGEAERIAKERATVAN